MNTKQKQKLKRFIQELARVRGRHTELVSVYIPAGYDIVKIIQHLQQEQGTASNIKDAKTRKNVIDSLERLVRHLRLYKSTPPDGLAAFAGNASEKEGQVDIRVWSIEPPEPLKTRLYRCDQTFVLDLLIGMLESKEQYGLIVMDRREGTLGLLKGTAIKVLTRLTSGVPGKIKAGGQCNHPDTLVKINHEKSIPISELKMGDSLLTYDFGSNQLKDTEVVDKWEKEKDALYVIKTEKSEIKCSKDHLIFTEKNNEVVEIPAEDISIGDTLFYINGDLKNERSKVTNIEIKNEKLKLIDISVKNQNFIANGIIVHNSAQRYARIREGMAKEFYKRIAEVANKEFLGKKELKGILIGGPGPTKEEFFEYLNTEIKNKVLTLADITYTDEFGLHNLVDKARDILANEVIMQEKKVMQRFFTLLAKEPEKVTYGLKEVKMALEMGAVEVLLLSEELDDKLIEEFENSSEKFKSEVQLISVETGEGAQLRDLGGIAAILRFRIS